MQLCDYNLDSNSFIRLFTDLHLLSSTATSACLETQSATKYFTLFSRLSYSIFSNTLSVFLVCAKPVNPGNTSNLLFCLLVKFLLQCLQVKLNRAVN